MSENVNIGNRRELFWDDFLIDTTKTTGYHEDHCGVRQDTALGRRYDARVD